MFPNPVRELKIEVDIVADMTVYNPFDFFVEDSARDWPFDYAEDISPDLVIYRACEPAGPQLSSFLGSIDRTKRGTVDFLVELNARVAREVGYVIRMEPGVQTLRRPSRRARARAVIQAGCWCRPCGTWGSRRALSLGT